MEQRSSQHAEKMIRTFKDIKKLREEQTHVYQKRHY